MKRMISFTLSILLAFSTFCGTFTLSALAAEENGDLSNMEKYCDTSGVELWINRKTGNTAIVSNGKIMYDEEVVLPVVSQTTAKAARPENPYYTKVFTCPQEKLASMKFYYENNGRALFGDENTGEIAFVTKSTGQILFTNPYDFTSYMSSDSTVKNVKERLLSQVIVRFSRNSTEEVYTSFAQAALNNQIAIKKIRGGIRAEYTIGREEVRKLVPRQIERSSFEKNILSKITLENAGPGDTQATVDRELKIINAYYSLKTKADAVSRAAFPITDKYDIYVFNELNPAERELYVIEEIIKKYTDYTFEMLEEDHRLVEYEGSEKAPPLFKLAIEYYIDENDGFKVRFPAKSIRYDSSSYKLNSIQFLPFLGAGSNHDQGFTFIPDGSGAIVDFKDVANKAITITGRLYGQDHSYHKVSGANQEVMRLPAFGVAKTSEYFIGSTPEEKVVVTSNEEAVALQAAAAAAKEQKKPKDGIPVTEKSGYVAYFEEGDSLTEVSTNHGGGVEHIYNSVYTTLYTQPTDTYALNGITASGGGNATWSVQSDRKYTGNYTVRILPLYEDEADYSGMAKAVRNYLEDIGVLTKLKDDGNKDIPLYLENFGSIETQQRFAGIPVKVQTPLTKFEQSKEMLEDLKSEGISNINLKYTGWYNGGLYHTIPNSIKIQSVLGGESGFKKLVEYTKENGIGFYPDLEYTYVNKVGVFDGFNYKRDSVKTIDNRSAVHKIYSALFQGFESDMNLILSPAVLQRIYLNSMKKYLKLDVGGISAATLGSDLNADHNKDYPLNREESKEMVIDILAKMQEDNKSIMVSGGNAYTLKYVDHVLDVPLDSSRNVYASASIPFVGMVLHGYKEFAGTAINLDGDYSYSLLKAIENGANPYFILSYTKTGENAKDDFDNTSELKKFVDFSKFYSIKYNIWYEDLIKTYKTLNDALKDVKYSTISKHEIIDTRVVKVTYSNGKAFVLNYNNKPYQYENNVVGALGFVVVK